MHPKLTFGRWHVLLSLVSLSALVALATMPQLLGDQVAEAFHGLMDVSPAWLWLAAVSFATALAASGCAWRSALSRCGGELTRADASARYGVGSLVNAFVPAKVGSAVRFALFSRVLHGEGRLWTTGGVCASIGAARSIWLALLLAFGAASGVLPVWPLGLLALAVAVAVGVAYVARDRSPSARVAHVLDAFRALGRSPRAAAQLVGWIGLATAARIGAATAIAAAFGVEQPLLAALLVVPALDLAGILPLTPGNIGVASAAVAFALHAHGAAADTAISAGIAFSAVETVTSLAFGTGSALYLVGAAPGARRWTATAAAATACLGLGVAFGATVVLPLV
jgi:uncharacterized membrane protein YbhN (UPF0104 family)